MNLNVINAFGQDYDVATPKPSIEDSRIREAHQAALNNLALLKNAQQYMELKDVATEILLTFLEDIGHVDVVVAYEEIIKR